MKLTLKKYNTTYELDLPCLEGSFAAIGDVTTGTHTDKDGHAWDVTKTVYGSYQIIQAVRYDNYVDLAEEAKAAASLVEDLPAFTWDPVEYMEVLTSQNYGSGIYCAPDVNVNNPAYEYQFTVNTPSSSMTQDISITFNFRASTAAQSFSFGARKYVDSRFYAECAMIPVVFKTTSGLGDFVFGYVVYSREKISATAENKLLVVVDASVNIYNFTEPDEDPGEKGFKPTAARTTKNRPGNGGRGTAQKKQPEYKSSQITQPGAPNESVASAIGSKFINPYKIDKTNLAAVGSCLWGSDLAGFLANIYVNPLDFIVSLCVFPTSPSVGSAEAIRIGKYRCLVGDGGLGFDASGYPLANQFKVINFGTITIPENWGNYLDYSQTTLELYLPFIGSVNLDTSECMGGTINVQYTIDFLTGMCVANVLCTKANFVLPSGKGLDYVNAQHSFQGNCAIQIPLSRVDYGSMVGSLINACTQGITNPVAGFAGVVTDAIGGGFRPNVTSKGNIVANSGYCSVLYPYVRITRPITAEPDSYQEVMGYPSYINTTLGECSDLCICEDIDLTGIAGATENELNKIRQLCKDGVYV